MMHVETKLIWLDPEEFSLENISTLQNTVLTKDELEYCKTLTFEGRNREFTLGRALLRYGLKLYLGQKFAKITLVKSENGKPVLPGLPGHNIYFNIAHTSGCVVCCFTRHGEIGVDVERLDRADTIDNVKSRVFANAELVALAKLSGANRRNRLLELWTGKEAYTKARGVGLGAEFTKISLNPSAGFYWLCDDLALGGALQDWLFHKLVLRHQLHVTMVQKNTDRGKEPPHISQVTVEKMLQMKEC